VPAQLPKPFWLALLVLTACGGKPALPASDWQAIGVSADLDTYAAQHAAEGKCDAVVVDINAAHCALEGVMGRNGQAMSDAGVRCAP